MESFYSSRQGRRGGEPHFGFLVERLGQYLCSSEDTVRVGRNRAAKSISQPYGVSIHASCRSNLNRFHSSYQKEPLNNRISIIQMTFTSRKPTGQRCSTSKYASRGRRFPGTRRKREAISLKIKNHSHQADNAGGDLPPRPGIMRVTIISPSLH